MCNEEQNLNLKLNFLFQALCRNCYGIAKFGQLINFAYAWNWGLKIVMIL